jgi:hypothetical protein
MNRIKCPKCLEKGEEMYLVKDFLQAQYVTYYSDSGRLYYEMSEYEPYGTAGEYYCESCGYTEHDIYGLVEKLRQEEQTNEQ